MQITTNRVLRGLMLRYPRISEHTWKHPFPACVSSAASLRTWVTVKDYEAVYDKAVKAAELSWPADKSVPGLPVDFISACLHVYLWNTYSSTHRNLFHLQSILPSALICNRTQREDGVDVHNQSRACLLWSPRPPNTRCVSILTNVSRTFTEILCSWTRLQHQNWPTVEQQALIAAVLQVCEPYWPGLWTDPMLGSLHIWTSLSVEKFTPPPTSNSHPYSPTSHQCRAGSLDASITARQGDDIMPHWQGYLSRDKECFFCFVFFRGSHRQMQLFQIPSFSMRTWT